MIDFKKQGAIPNEGHIAIEDSIASALMFAVVLNYTFFDPTQRPVQTLALGLVSIEGRQFV